MQKIFGFIVSVLLISGIMSQPLQAADEGFYMGVGIGGVSVEHRQEKLSLEFPSLGSAAQVDTSNYGIHLLAGYWFDSYLGMEMSVQDVPQFKATSGLSKTSLYGMQNYAITAIARQAIAEHEVFAKVGLNIWSICSGNNCGDELESGQSLTYGAGVNLNIYDSGARMMRLEWEHTAIDSVYLKALDVISLNIVFNFNGPE